MQIIYTHGLRNCLNLMKNKIKRFLIKYNIVSELTFSRMQKHWIRIVCDKEIHRFISNLNKKSLSILEISGKRWQYLFPPEKYDSFYYPEFDISQVEDFQKTYDLIGLSIHRA